MAKSIINKSLKKINPYRSSRKKHKTGLPPGSVIYTGEEKKGELKLKQIEYFKELYKERDITSLEELKEIRNTETIDWIMINGVHDTKVIKELGKIFDINIMHLEDIANPDHPPKIEIHQDYIFIIMKYLSVDKEANVISEQVNILLGDTFVLMFLENGIDDYSEIIERIQKPSSRFKQHGSGYLAYAIMDYIVDHYFLLLDKYEIEIEKIDLALTDQAKPEILDKIRNSKQELIQLRRSFRPLKEMVKYLINNGDKFYSEDTLQFLKDLQDHVNEVYDTEESQRESLAVLMDVFMSLSDYKMNEIMKILTVISTIFLPLTFLAGIYGMNFDHMPELHWWWAYPALWGVMIMMSTGMIMFFKKKGWF